MDKISVVHITPVPNN